MSENRRDAGDLLVDDSLLRGFRFACLPNCGLCCYATPAVSSAERPKLIAFDPSTPFLPGENGYSRVSARPGGGACHFLSGNRCRCHSIRPFPCREFPLSVHIGSRVQASVQLFCPGVPIEPLIKWGEGAGPTAPPVGLDDELKNVMAEHSSAPVGKWVSEGKEIEASIRRRVEKHGEWLEPDALRADLFASLPGIQDLEFGSEVEDPDEIPLDELLLFRDEDAGISGLRRVRNGWEVLAMNEGGGVKEIVGVYQLPSEDIELEEKTSSLLRGFLAYALGRDQLLWSVYMELQNYEDATPFEIASAFLLEAATQAVTIGTTHALMHGRAGHTLSFEDLGVGIRPADMLLMDQPTIGRIL